MTEPNHNREEPLKGNLKVAWQAAPGSNVCRLWWRKSDSRRFFLFNSPLQDRADKISAISNPCLSLPSPPETCKCTHTDTHTEDRSGVNCSLMPQHPNLHPPLCYAKCPLVPQAPWLLTYNPALGEIIKSTFCIHYRRCTFLRCRLINRERGKAGGGQDRRRGRAGLNGAVGHSQTC